MIFDVDDVYEIEEGYEIKLEKKDKEIKRLNNIINEFEGYIKQYLYMLNGITDRDVYEEQQLDDITEIMEKLQELKGDGSSE